MTAVYQSRRRGSIISCIIRMQFIVLGVLYESYIHPLTILSGLPSAGFGAGAESRKGLGLAVVGGLLVSQLLTLYITPVVYYYMDRLQFFVINRYKKPVETR